MTGGRDGPAERPTDAPSVVRPAAIEAGADPLGIGAGEAPPGTYALVYSLPSATIIEVGARGTAAFPAGAYAYVGSAFGSNGLGRVDRHRRVAAGAHDVRHWHVDYLGGHEATSLDAVVAAPGADVECDLAGELTELTPSDPEADRPIDGFGASDCDCPTHLMFGDSAETLRSRIVEAFDRIDRQE